MIGQFMVFRAMTSMFRRSGYTPPVGGNGGDPEMVDNSYPNYGVRHEVARCRECGDPKCALPNEHTIRGCESGLGLKGWHAGMVLVYRLEFTNGDVSYAKLCEVCADAGGNSGTLRDLRRSWFGRRWKYKLTNR